VDIKTIATGIGLVITIAGLFVFQGQLIERVDVLEQKKSVDIKPMERDIAVMKAEIAVLETRLNELIKKQSNPLSQ
tara:strand:+ start:703 stop:930 length:228 start_codon:yes stop_codon:yes gene_type:complete